MGTRTGHSDNSDNSDSLLRPSEQPFLEEGADAEDVGGDDAEADDQQGQKDRKGGIQHKVMTIGVEERSDSWQVRQEKIVNQIDI